MSALTEISYLEKYIVITLKNGQIFKNMKIENLLVFRRVKYFKLSVQTTQILWQ